MLKLPQKTAPYMNWAATIAFAQCTFWNTSGWSGTYWPQPTGRDGLLCNSFGMHFADKISHIHSNFDSTFCSDWIRLFQRAGLFSSVVYLTAKNVYWIPGSLRPPTCLYDPCSWLLKFAREGWQIGFGRQNIPPREGMVTAALKQAVVYPP